MAGAFEGPNRVQCLGLLGQDLDANVEAELRALASSRPSRLDQCVEDMLVSFSMSRRQSGFLMELAEAYYVERPRVVRSPGLGTSSSLNDEGIRAHLPNGFFGPLAGWDRGPFWQIMRAHTPGWIAFVNRMLNHAARCRVATLRRLGADDVEVSVEGINGETVLRTFVGDPHVWRWYRGTGVGPYPCASALLAAERFADQMLAHGYPLRNVTAALLADCENLAMPGLVVGLLINRIEEVTDELDPWLANPFVWNFEVSRRTAELAGFRNHGADSDPPTRTQRRRMTLREVASLLVVRALDSNDDASLARLANVGARLVATASQLAPPRCANDSREDAEIAACEDYLLRIRASASALDSKNFSAVITPQGQRGYEHNIPADIVAARADDAMEASRATASMHLVNVYGDGPESAWPASILEAIEEAKSLQRDPPRSRITTEAQAPAAVASAAISCHVKRRILLTPDVLAWAVDTLLALAEPREVDAPHVAYSVYPIGPDRLAARGLAHSLQLGDGDLDVVRQASIVRAVRLILASPVHEVRRVFAESVASLWSAQCRTSPGGMDCLHRDLLSAAREAARQCVFGERDESGQRQEPVLLAEPFEQSLERVPNGRLRLDRISLGLSLVAGCAESTNCCASDAATLRDVLIAAYGRARIEYGARSNHLVDEDEYQASAAMLHPSCGEPLLAMIRLACGTPSALGGILRSLTAVGTYDPERRVQLCEIWPLVMDVVMDAIDGGQDVRHDRHQGCDAFALTIPFPNLRNGEQDIDRALQRAAVGWPRIESLASRIERWLSLGPHDHRGVDALVRLLMTASPQDQATIGLEWVARLVVSKPQSIAGHSIWIDTWLRGLAGSVQFNADQQRTYNRIVDALVMAGATRVLDLQVSGER